MADALDPTFQNQGQLSAKDEGNVTMATCFFYQLVP